MNGMDLKVARKTLRLGQKELGAAIGVTGQTIWNYERGEGVDIPKAAALAVECLLRRAKLHGKRGTA